MSISRIPSLLVKRKPKYDKSSTGDVLDVLTTMLRISNSIVKHQTFNSMRLVISEGGTCMAMRMSWSKNRKNDDEEPISIVNSSHLPRRFQKLYVSSCIMLLCIIKLILLYDRVMDVLKWMCHSENLVSLVYHSDRMYCCSLPLIVLFTCRIHLSWSLPWVKLKLLTWNVYNLDWRTLIWSLSSRISIAHLFTSTPFPCHNWITSRTG